MSEATGRGSGPGRRKRLEEALKANLKRRKAQGRARRAAAKDRPAGGVEPLSDTALHPTSPKKQD